MKSLLKVLTLIALLFAQISYAHADAASDMKNAIKKGNIEKVQEILSSGFDVNAKITGSKSTPLIVAAAHPKSKTPEIMKLLITAGADLNYRNNKGKSALSYAKGNNSRTIINLLKEAGAKN